MTHFSFPHSPGRNSILSMLGWMGVVHWLDESGPKIAKRDRCRGACTVYHGMVNSASACASIPFVASLLTMPMLLDCSSGCCVWDFVAGILLYYGGSWVTCFTFSMAVPATASSGLLAASHFARLCWLVVIHYTSPFLSSKSRRKIAGYVHATWLCTMNASLRKVLMSWFAFEQRPKPAYLLYIGDFTTRLYRDYSKSVFGFLWTNQYNGMSQGFWMLFESFNVNP